MSTAKMAQRILATVLEGWARDYFAGSDDADNTANSLEYIALQVENGTTLATIAERISTECGLDVSRAELTRYLTRKYTSTVKARLDVARSIGAGALVDEAMSLAEEEIHDKLHGISQRLRVSTRLAIAARYDGPKASLHINAPISFQSLHLHALRARSQSDAQVIPALQHVPEDSISGTYVLPDVRNDLKRIAQVVEAEIVTE